MNTNGVLPFRRLREREDHNLRNIRCRVNTSFCSHDCSMSGEVVDWQS